MSSLFSTLESAIVLAATALASAPYDPTIAKRMVAYSDAAYCGDVDHGGVDPITNWTCPPCTLLSADFSLSSLLSNTTRQTFGFAGVDSALDAPVLSFRGSVLPINFVDDDDTRQQRWWPPNASVHAGFLRSYSSLQPQAFEITAKLITQKPGRPVYVTGHSLGAAQATLAALDLAANFTRTQFVVINFGDLRCGDDGFVRAYKAQSNLQTWRVTHRADKAPQLVPRSTGLRHVPREVWYADDLKPGGELGGTAFVMCDGSGEDDACELSVANASLNWNDHDLYLNHSMWCCAGGGGGLKPPPGANCQFPFPNGPRRSRRW